VGDVAALSACSRRASITGALSKAQQQNRWPKAGRRSRRIDPGFDELCGWIDFFNGHVHHKLDLAITSLGCRCGTSREASDVDDDQYIAISA
jgi:hypothetical protein